MRVCPKRPVYFQSDSSNYALAKGKLWCYRREGWYVLLGHGYNIDDKMGTKWPRSNKVPEGLPPCPCA